MSTPNMTLQLDMPAGTGAVGYVRLVASSEDNTAVAATADGVAVAGETLSKAGVRRTVTDGVTTNGDATLTSVTAKWQTSDIGRPVSGTGIPASTVIASVTSSTSVELSANATASATGVTLTIDTDGLLVFPAMNPNTGSSGDVIDDPVGTVWMLVIRYPRAPTPDPVYFTVPDTAGPHIIGGAYLTSRPGALAPPGAGNTALAGDVIDTANNNALRPLVKKQLTNQADLFPRWNALLGVADRQRVDVLVPADSMTRRTWSWASTGVTIPWLEQVSFSFRELGIPATSDWRTASAPAISGVSDYVTTGAAGTHGFGAEGITLDAGEYWETTFGGATVQDWDLVPGDAYEVFVTMQASGGGLAQVLLDGVQVQAATTTTDATPSAVLGHRRLYASPLLDGDEHTVRIVASGAGTVKLDGVLVHHGTRSAGVVLWNGGKNGSTVQTHLDAGGFEAAVKVLDAAGTLGLVILPSGVVAYITDTTGASYIAGQQNAIDMVRAESDADVWIVHQPEFAGFGSLSNTWLNWGTTTLPLIEDLAETEGCAFTSLYRPVGSRANQALTDSGVDIYTHGAPLSFNDYVHVNEVGQGLYAGVLWPVLSQGRGSFGIAASAGSVDSINGETGVVVLTAADVGAIPIDAEWSSVLPGGGRVQLEDVTGLEVIPIMYLRRSGDAFQRFAISSEGLAWYDPTTGTGDITMSRASAGIATLGTSKLQSSAAPTTGNDFTNKTYTDATFQPLDADLTALAGLTSAADKVPYFTGSGTATVADLTSYGRSLVATANRAALMSLLGLTFADIAAGTMLPGGGGSIVISNFGTIPLTGWRISGDIADRMQVSGAGFTIGDGSAAGDVSFNRVSAGVGSFGASQVRTSAVPSNASDLTNKLYTDARDAASIPMFFTAI
jgi:hypothetical protein